MNRNLNFLIVLISALLVSIVASAQSEIFIAPNGNDNNAGTISSPLKTLYAARNKARSSGAKTIMFRGGRYSYNNPTSFDGKDAGLTISGYRNEKVIIDGIKRLDASKFSKITDANLLNRLHTRAQNSVFSMNINQSDIISLLENTRIHMTMDDILLTVARFPNIGYAHMNLNTIDNSQEKVNVNGTPTNPKGAKFKLHESFNTAKWQAELERNKQASISGFYSADWWVDNSRIYSVGGDGNIHLMDGSRYGVKKRHSSQNRMYIKRMLCEIDEPGEWYYDTKDRRLYLWPMTPITSNSRIGLMAGVDFIKINNGSNIKIQKMTIQNVGNGGSGKAVITISDGSNKCEVAGVTMRNIANLTPIRIEESTNCGVKSCNFFDYQSQLRLGGGKITSTSITHGRNYIENCHFTHIFAKNFGGKTVSITGAGQIFRNNLAHNLDGHSLTFYGNDHILERNEFFNVGFEKGDGGAFYTGGQVFSYGNVVKHNFIHHMMSVPSLVTRCAFYSDDYDGGELYKENVVYKGSQGVKMNKGGGHTVTKNVLMENEQGIVHWNDRRPTPKFYNKSMDYIRTGKATSADKENYIGRVLAIAGKPGWQNGLTVDNWFSRIEPFWLERYPALRIKLRGYQRTMRMDGFENRFYDNLFYGNTTDIDYERTAGNDRGSQRIQLGLFENPRVLNFKFKSPRPAYAPNIPFEKIGLYKDEYRCAVPDKNKYRTAIKNRFEGQDSYALNVPYDISTINQRIYYNSGKMMMRLIPCEGVDVPNEPIPGHEYKYDLGTSTSPIFEGYTRMTAENVEGLYEWSDLSYLKTVDRGNLNGANDINRDYVFSEGRDVGLVHNVENGSWKVRITVGDAKDGRNSMRFTAEGKTIAANVSTGPGEVKTLITAVEVKDKKLNLGFYNDGTARNRWSVTRIWFTKINPASKLETANVPVSSNLDVYIYPNPTTNKLTVNYNGEITNPLYIVVYDNLGRKALSTTSLTNSSTLNLKGLSPGLYYIQISNGTKFLSQKTIIKE